MGAVPPMICTLSKVAVLSTEEPEVMASPTYKVLPSALSVVLLTVVPLVLALATAVWT